MADMNGWDLAGDFYQSVFPDRIYGKQGKHHYYYERPARAPRDAVNVTAEKQMFVISCRFIGQWSSRLGPPASASADLRRKATRKGLVSRIWYCCLVRIDRNGLAHSY